MPRRANKSADETAALAQALRVFPDDAVFTSRCTAAMLGITESGLSRRRDRGTGPAFRRNGPRMCYAKADLLAFAEANARNAAEKDSAAPLRKRCAPGSWPVSEDAHPLVHFLFSEIAARGLSENAAAKLLGKDNKHLRNWRTGTAPSIQNLSDFLDFFGYEIVAQKKKNA